MKVILSYICAAGFLTFCFCQTQAAPVATNPPTGFRLVIELQDGSRIIGQSGDDNLQFHSEVLGEMKLPLERIRSINCQPKTNSVQLITATGDTLTAQFVTKAVRTETVFGNVKLPVSLIRRLTVSPMGKPGQMREGLVGLWSGEGDGNDSVGDNPATLMGNVTFAGGKVGQAFLFDGVNSYMSIPDSPSLETGVSSITVEFWMKAGQLTRNADWKGLVTKGNSSWRLQATSRAKTITFSVTSAGSNVDMFGNRNVNDGQWHHVAGVYDGTNLFLYVDGTLDVSQPGPGPISQNGEPVCFGANSKAYVPGCGCNKLGYFFDGLIDEVAIYNRALPASEIQADYDAGNGRQ